jgi:pentose-5-phosphate-3-epimerase
VALNPATPLERVRHVLDQVDVLLVMTVNPGFSGQTYLQTMEPKVAGARRLIERTGLPTLIGVDGGISAATAPGAVRAGAQLLVRVRPSSPIPRDGRRRWPSCAAPSNRSSGAPPEGRAVR